MKTSNKKILAGATALAFLASIGAASAQQGTQQQDRGPAPNAVPSQPQGGQMKEPEGRSPGGPARQSTQPSGEKPGAAATQDIEKKSQQGQRENNQRQGQTGSPAPQRQGQDGATTTQRQGQTQNTKKSGQTQTEQKPGSDSKAAASTELNSEQRTRISQNIRKQNVRRVTNVNFNIAVGTVVPRSYTFYPVPAPVVAVVPAYRGYLYIVVGDEMLIIHPRTYEIVAVIAV